MKLQTFDLNYFVGKNFGDDDFVNYQPIINTLELKKDQDTDYVLSWKLKGVHTSHFKPLYTAFLYSIKLCRYKIEIKFDKTL